MMAHKTLTLLLTGVIGLMGQEATATMQGLNQGTVIIGRSQSGLNGYHSTPVSQYQSPHSSAPGSYPYTADARKNNRPAKLYYPPTSYPRSLMTVAGFASSAQPIRTQRTVSPRITNNPAGMPVSSFIIGDGQQASNQKPERRQPHANRQRLTPQAVTPAVPDTTAIEPVATAPVRPVATTEPPAPPQPVAPVEPVAPPETTQETTRANALPPVATGASDIITLTPPPTLEASLPPDVSDPATLEIVFEAQSFALDDADIAQLDRLSAAMTADDGLDIQLLAYARGSDDQASQARRLSLSRALAVRGFLMERGIRSTRMQVRALGNKTTGGNPDRVNIIPRQ